MFKKALLFITLSLSVANFSGCIFLAAGAAGAGTAKWLSDKVTQTVNVPIDKVTKATRSALKDMNANVYKETNAPDVTQILAKDSNGQQIWVDLRPINTNDTNISVRVGYLNGEKDAGKILGRIVDKSNSWI
jgi:Protein of unknown function (DUF3568)